MQGWCQHSRLEGVKRETAGDNKVWDQRLMESGACWPLVFSTIIADLLMQSQTTVDLY